MAQKEGGKLCGRCSGRNLASSRTDDEMCWLGIRSLSDGDQHILRNAGHGRGNHVVADGAGARRTLRMAVAEHSNRHRQHGCDEHDRDYHAPDFCSARHVSALSQGRNAYQLV